MTRQEFIEDVNSFGDLIEFCSDEGIDDICNDIFDAISVNDIVLDYIKSLADWEEARRFLIDIPVGCDYYREDGYGGFEDAEYLFDDYKTDVIRNMDASCSWDEEDSSDEYEDEDEETEWDSAEAQSYDAQQIKFKSEEDDIETTSFISILGRVS